MPTARLSAFSNAFAINYPLTAATTAPMPARQTACVPSDRRATAVVYCEANFGSLDGKTANGLVRHSEKYEILSVIDSQKAGLDAGEVLGEAANGIPICTDLAAAMVLADGVPDYYIFGMAPSSGLLSPHQRGLVHEAIGLGMNIVNGLHEFLNDDPEFAAASIANNVTSLDIRRPRAKKDLRMFSDRITEHPRSFRRRAPRRHHHRRPGGIEPSGVLDFQPDPARQPTQRRGAAARTGTPASL